MNDLRNIRVSVEAVNKSGKHAQGAICYTTSPIHTLERFVQLGKDMQEMGCASVAIKDMAGLLTPAISAKLVKALVEDGQQRARTILERERSALDILGARLQEKEVLTGDEVQALLEEHQHLRAKD